MKRLSILLLALLIVLMAISSSATMTDDDDLTESVSSEIVEIEDDGPTELEYLKSINTYTMYLFAFGVVWLLLMLCSLVYKLLRIFI